jgi:hypothetical protein
MSPVPVTTLAGYPGHVITAEVSDGPPGFTVLGWTARETEWMRDQVQRLLGTLYPQRRITVDVDGLPAGAGRLASAIARAVHIDHTY